MSGAFQPSKYNAATTETSVSFLSLPGELRNRIYTLVLSQQEAINPWSHVYREQKITSGLLRANKAIHGEASSVFYGQNRFDFTDASSKEVLWFFKKIGSNSGYIRHLLVDLPMFFYPDCSGATLKDDSLGMLEGIRSSCANLSTLTTSLDSTNHVVVMLDNLDNLKVATEVLELIDDRFRAISSIEEIILEVYEDGPSLHIRRRMESYGWTIHAREPVEEEDWDGNSNDFDDDFYRDEYGSADDEYVDDYDIDNDSDFWRRAAD